MKDNTVDVEVVAAEIVRCPRCGARNRLVKQQEHVGYRCGGCWASLANPFVRFSSIKRSLTIGKFIAGLVGAIVLVSVVLRPHEPSSTTGINSTVRFPPQLVPSHPTAWTPPVPPREGGPLFPALKTRTAPPLEMRPLPSRETPSTPPRSLENGTILFDVINAGHNKFTVENGTDRDAVVKLIDSTRRQTVVAIYVTAHSSATANLIPEGTFTALCGQGVDWDDKINFFTRNRSFEKFEPDLNFTMTLRQEGRQIIHEYHYVSLGLEPSVTGEMTKSDMSEQTFMEY
jgi:hypothetical protein